LESPHLGAPFWNFFLKKKSIIFSYKICSSFFLKKNSPQMAAKTPKKVGGKLAPPACSSLLPL